MQILSNFIFAIVFFGLHYLLFCREEIVSSKINEEKNEGRENFGPLINANTNSENLL